MLATHQIQGSGSTSYYPSLVWNRNSYQKTIFSRCHVSFHRRYNASSASISVRSSARQNSTRFLGEPLKINILNKRKTRRLCSFPARLSSTRSGAEEAKNRSPKSSNSIATWLSNLQTQTAVERVKEVFLRTQLQLKVPEGDKIIKDIQQIEWQQQILNIWQCTPNWVTWSVVVWLACFSAASIQLGVRVSCELFPLWTIAALVSAICIRYFKSACIAVMEMVVGFIQATILKITKYVKEKRLQFLDFRANWKQHLHTKRMEIGEQLVDAYWDFIEKRMWKQYRAVSQFIRTVLFV